MHRASRSIILGLFLVASLAEAGFANSFQDTQYQSLEELHAQDPQEALRARAFSRTVAATPVSAEVLQPVSISVIYPGDQVSDYWRRSVLSMINRLDDSGIAYSLTNNFTRPGQETGRQAELLAAALDTSPDYLIFTLDIEEHANFIEQAIARGRSRIILQNITTPITRWRGRQPFLYVGFDHQTGTRMLADAFIEITGGVGRYAILFGTQGYVSKMRGDTFRVQMDSHPGMQLVDAFYVGFDRQKARQATEQLLENHPDIRAIYCVSTDIAFGALDAVRAAGRLDDIIINGWGGGSQELDALRAGELDLTVMRMNDDNGVAMADAIRLDQSGRSDEVPLVYSGEFHLLTKYTSDQLISVLEQRAFRYSN